MAQELSADEELEPPVGIKVGDGGIEVLHAPIGVAVSRDELP